MKDLNIYVHTLNQSETNLYKQLIMNVMINTIQHLHTIRKLPKNIELIMNQQQQQILNTTLTKVVFILKKSNTSR